MSNNFIYMKFSEKYEWLTTIPNNINIKGETVTII